MADFMKHVLSKPIQLTAKVIKSAERATSFMEDCNKLKSHTEELAKIFSQMMALSISVSYQRPVRRIIGETEQVLNSTLSLVLKCSSNGDRKRVLRKPCGLNLKETLNQLQECFSDVIRLQYMLISIYVPKHDQIGFVKSLLNRTHNSSKFYLDALYVNHRYRELWEELRWYFGSDYTDRYEYLLSYYQDDDFKKVMLWHTRCIIGYLYDRSVEDNRLFWEYFLLLLSEISDEHKSLIIEEGGIVPLLKLLQMGSILEQKFASKVIGTLAYDSQSAEHVFEAGVCVELVKLLKEGRMTVQTQVAWAISRLTANSSMVQDYFAKRQDIMRLLINLLAFETIEDHHVENVNIINKATSVRAFVMAKSLENTSSPNEDHTQNENISHSNAERELEEPRTKAYLKTKVAEALWRLAKGNPSVCRNISQSKALICFVVLLEKGIFEKKGIFEYVKYYSAMALMEITAVVEQDSDLRRSVYKPSLPTCKSLIDQLVNVIESEIDYGILNPCIKAIGNLSKIFRVPTARIFSSLLDKLIIRPVEIQEETLIALTKFACTDNYLHIDHSKSIVSAGGAKHLVQLVDSRFESIQFLSLRLLCYIAIHVPDENGLVEAKVLDVLKRRKHFYLRDDTLRSLIPKATIEIARAH